MMKITATHRYGYKPGTWFIVAGIAMYKGRPCYQVVIPHPEECDNYIDHWPVYDPAEPYDFKEYFV